MRRARAIAFVATGLVAFASVAGPASARTTKLNGFANKPDRPSGYLLAGDELHVSARYFIPKEICKPKVRFTLTDSSGKKFRVGRAHPKFGTYGEGAINRGLKVVPSDVEPGKATLRSRQKCRLGQASGKDTVRIIDPKQPLPRITEVGALDVMTNDETVLAFSVDRYAYVNVVVEWELVPGEWRLVDVARTQEFLPEAGTYSIEWKANAGGRVPPGRYRFRVTPRAPGVGDGQQVTQEFYVADEFRPQGGDRRGGPARFQQPRGIDVNPLARIFVSDFAGRLRGLRPSGEVIPENDFAGGSFGLSDGVFGPADSTEERDTGLFVADAAGRRVVKQIGANQGQVIGSAGTGPGQFAPQTGPQALAATSANGGRVYVVDGTLPRVQAFDLGGTLQQTISGNGLVTPRGVAVGPPAASTLWVADPGSGLRQFSAAGAPIPGAGVAGTPVTVEVRPDGQVLAAEAGPNPNLILHRPSSAGGLPTRFGGRLVKDPHGIASAGIAGDFYVSTGSRVLHFRAP